jgi:hypothetical protein
MDIKVLIGENFMKTDNAGKAATEFIQTITNETQNMWHIPIIYSK